MALSCSTSSLKARLKKVTLEGGFTIIMPYENVKRSHLPLKIELVGLRADAVVLRGCKTLSLRPRGLKTIKSGIFWAPHTDRGWIHIYIEALEL